MSTNNYQVSEIQTRKRTRCQSFLRFLWNPDSKAVCGRTCLSWLLLTIFYTCFYAFLAAYFAVILSIYVHGIVNQQVPFLTGQQSLLRDGPGVGISPLFRSDKNDTISSTLVYVTVGSNITSSTTFMNYTTVTELLLNPYRTNGLLQNQVDCSDDDLINITQACQFNLTALGPCADPVQHLQKDGIICMFITLNKLYGWLPDVDNSSGPLIQCVGQNPADTENAGVLNYYPNGGMYQNATAGLIRHVYFPFLRQDNYSTPIVAVEFANIAQNVAIMMFCEVANVDSGGQSQFEIMVDNMANATTTNTTTVSISVTTLSSSSSQASTTGFTTTTTGGSTTGGSTTG